MAMIMLKEYSPVERSSINIFVISADTAPEAAESEVLTAARDATKPVSEVWASSNADPGLKPYPI
jgi:hypothetical protein